MIPKKIIPGGYKILKDLTVTHRNVTVASKCGSMDEALEVVEKHREGLRKRIQVEKDVHRGSMKYHYVGVSSAPRVILNDQP